MASKKRWSWVEDGTTKGVASDGCERRRRTDRDASTATAYKVYRIAPNLQRVAGYFSRSRCHTGPRLLAAFEEAESIGQASPGLNMSTRAAHVSIPVVHPKSHSHSATVDSTNRQVASDAHMVREYADPAIG